MQRLHGAMRGTTQRLGRGLVAIVLCYTLCLPVPLGLAQQAATDSQATRPAKRRPEYASGQLQADERILHALNRFTFGPKPGDLEAVRAMGLEKWFDAQLHPATIDETDLNARLAQYPAMQWSVQDLIFRLPSNAIIRQAADWQGENASRRHVARGVRKPDLPFSDEKSGASRETSGGDGESGNGNGDGTRDRGTSHSSGLKSPAGGTVREGGNKRTRERQRRQQRQHGGKRGHGVQYA